MGRSVVVLAGARRRPTRAEALTPGVADIVRYLKADGILARAEAIPVQRHRVAWATRDAVAREAKPGEASLLVHRHRFDAELAEAASAQGVLIRPSSRLIGVEKSGREHLVRYSHDGVERVVLARHVLEATGRPRGAKRKQLGPPLIALSASFEGTVGDECEMLVEALADCWIWATRRPCGVLNVTAFSDPGHVHVNWPGEPKRALRAMLASSAHLPAIEYARSFVGVCDAGSYLCEDWFQDGHWKIGDAALCLDPLSSSGVEKSMRFALQTALGVNTVLTSNGDSNVAREFLARKLNDACTSHLAWTKEHYSSAWHWPTEPFWKTRGSRQSALEGRRSVSAQIDRRQMSQMLLGAPCIATDVVINRSPCALDDHIETKGAVFHPSLSEPVVFVDGVELAPLLRAGRGVSSYPELIERWSRVLSRDSAIRICVWALQNGILTTDRGANGRSMANSLQV